MLGERFNTWLIVVIFVGVTEDKIKNPSCQDKPRILRQTITSSNKNSKSQAENSWIDYLLLRSKASAVFVRHKCTIAGTRVFCFMSLMIKCIQVIYISKYSLLWNTIYQKYSFFPIKNRVIFHLSNIIEIRDDIPMEIPKFAKNNIPADTFSFNKIITP